MKKYIYPMALTATLLATAACSDDEVNDIQQVPDSQKEQISFSLSDGAANTRAGLHSTSSTGVVLRIMSEKSGSSDKTYVRTKVTASSETTGADNSTYSTISVDGLYKVYWDDCFGRDALLSVYAVAVPGQAVSESSKLKETSLTAGDGSSSAKWGTNATNIINWSVSHQEGTEDNAQTSTTLTGEDLVYSRNIRIDGTDGRYVWDYNATPEGYPAETGNTTHTGGRMQFSLKPGATTTDAGHFDKGHLVFTHSLSRITLTLISGNGFIDSDDAETTHDFVLSDAGISFNGMNVAADLNLSDGSWGTKTTGTIIAKPTIGSTSVTIGSQTKTKASYSATVQMLPDYEFGKTSTTNVLSFTIDNNTYYVDQQMIYDALKESTGVTIANEKIKMEQQKNYHLNITINKTGIQLVTATLQPWTEVVAADKQLYNSYITLSISSANKGCDDIDLYRLGDGDGNIYTNLTSPTADSKEFYKWAGNYTDKAALTKLTTTSGDGKFKTAWYFEDNKTFYHFRTVKKGTTIRGAEGTGADATPDYFEIASGAQSNHDYHWGAPMKASPTFKYNPEANSASNTTEGYTTSIYKAIGSTTDEIKITELHMMSNINIVLETSAKTEGDHVNLSDAKVYLTKFYTGGQVALGSGLVTPTTSTLASSDVQITSPNSTDYWATTDVKTKPFTYAVVPQSLTRGTADGDYIGVTIVTSDNNQYYVIKDLSKIYATSIKQEGSDETYTDPDHEHTATSSSSDDDKVAAAITRWYPNHTYTYTFKITKKGIDNITCTLANWIDVTAANKDLTLED